MRRCRLVASRGRQGNDMRIDDKAQRLRAILQGYGRVAVAFSGGTDSSLLVKCALDALGSDNVLVVFGESELLKSREIDRALDWPCKHGYGPEVSLERVALEPLRWAEFVANAEDRCYRCKLRIYALFRERAALCGFPLLLDGTNVDDLQSGRPGLRAIQELGVKTPLAAAGFDKASVRSLSRQLGLSGWDHPSASCLATRIPTGMQIASERLRRIELWENGLEQFGLFGCRVRLEDEGGQTVRVAIRTEDFATLLTPSIRLTLLHFFQKNGVGRVLLDLEGR